MLRGVVYRSDSGRAGHRDQGAKNAEADVTRAAEFVLIAAVVVFMIAAGLIVGHKKAED